MEEARFFPSESGLQRKTELRSVHSFHQNAMPFAPCATQGPKETLFYSLRNAGLRKTIIRQSKSTRFPIKKYKNGTCFSRPVFLV